MTMKVGARPFQQHGMLIALLLIMGLLPSTTAAVISSSNRKLAATSTKVPPLRTGPVKFKAIQKPSTLPNGCLADFWTICQDPTSGDCNAKGGISGPYHGCDSALGWCMLPAYRSDTTAWEGIAWKHTDNYDDPECLYGWSLYNAAGEATHTAISSTMQSGRNQWCPLATFVVRADAAKWENKTWQRCP